MTKFAPKFTKHYKTNLVMNIGNIITKYGKTQAEVAAALGSTAGYVSQLISGKTAPSMKQLDRLADVIGCGRWEFFIDEMETAGYDAVKRETEQHNQPATSVEQEAGQEPTDQQQEPTAETKAEEARVLRFTYDCPHCGHVTRITIE